MASNDIALSLNEDFYGHEDLDPRAIRKRVIAATLHPKTRD
jgi:hypothetical protein